MPAGLRAGDHPMPARGDGDGAPALPVRLRVGVRHLILGAIAVGVVGLCGKVITWPLLSTAIGPTTYVLLAHPTSEAARLRNAAVGHTVAIGSGLLALAVCGRWGAPSIVELGHSTLTMDAAAALALGLTLFLLAVLHAHHAPAGASALLVATGIAAPGKPVLGLVVGLAIVLVVGSALAKAPFARQEAADSAG